MGYREGRKREGGESRLEDKDGEEEARNFDSRGFKGAWMVGGSSSECRLIMKMANGCGRKEQLHGIR